MHDYHANKTICNAAHVTLQFFLNTMSSNLKPLQFKVFNNILTINNVFMYTYIFLDFSKYYYGFAIGNYKMSKTK